MRRWRGRGYWLGLVIGLGCSLDAGIYRACGVREGGSAVPRRDHRCSCPGIRSNRLSPEESGVDVRPDIIANPDPTPEPTLDPTPEPTLDQTSDPTLDQTSDPTSEPTSDPTPEPTSDPTPEPAVEAQTTEAVTASTELFGPGEASGSDGQPLKLQDVGLGGSINGKSQIVSGVVLVDAATQGDAAAREAERSSARPGSESSRANPPFTLSEAR